MVRIAIGAAIGGLIQFIIGAIAWATPLGRLAFVGASDATAADLQAALGRNLTPTGSGTYFIPSPETAEGTVMLGKGPVALIHFNTDGFPVMDPMALLTGLGLSVLMMALIGVALSMIDGFARRMQALVLIAVATTLYFIFAMPVYNGYMPWAWWIYLGVECLIALIAGGFVMLRWFMPKAASVTAMSGSAPPL
jgi:hypothetical protein